MTDDVAKGRPLTGRLLLGRGHLEEMGKVSGCEATYYAPGASHLG